ncbi:uncharacterized protein LOC119769415 [Culex quinquefasciatus]|uniref:uncharacterized protein LOC119769415 n=1 Tax=Culex quinquefasciatus TaxID=7176 RepID=UPI0018E3535E|nr:uncharacterized protein LOC119769415 [Culex quinquefasciatus]
MSSKERFCTYGYVYAAIGIISSILHMMGMNSHYAMESKDGLINEAYHMPRSVEVSSGLFSLVFFIILIVGIYQKNITLVKIFKVVLVISGVLGYIVLFCGFLLAIANVIEDSQRNFGAILLLILVIALAIYTAFFKLVLWIINGLVDYIEHLNEDGKEAVTFNEQINVGFEKV